MLQKISFILSFFVFANMFVLEAQDKDIQKIAELFEHSEYEKCIEKSKKTIKKYSNVSEPYYYVALSNFELYKSATNLRKKMYLTTTINNLNFGLLRDKDSSKFEEFRPIMNAIHDTIKIFASDLWAKNKSEAGFFYKNIAKIYQDTTPEYIELYVPVTRQSKQKLAFREYSGNLNETDIAGNRQGLWVKKYDNGFVEYEIFFKDNHPAGTYRKYYDNGNLKADMFFNQAGTRAGAVLYDYNGKRVAMGYYANKQKDSLWQYFMNDSIVIAEENYNKGIKDGVERSFNPYKYPMLMEEKFWKNGKQDSTWTRFFLNGKPAFITEYKNGLREGKYVSFSSEGNTQTQGQYKNGKMSGKWKIWSETELKIVEIEYENGIPVNNDVLSEQESKMLKEMLDMKTKYEEPENRFFKNHILPENEN